MIGTRAWRVVLLTTGVLARPAPLGSVQDVLFRSPDPPTEARASNRRRLSRHSWRSAARYVLPVLSVMLVVGLVVRTVAGNSHEVGRSLHLLTHPKAVYVALASLAEMLSYGAYATAQQRLACAMDHRLSRGWLASLAVAAQALVNFLAAGYLAGNVLNFRELRRRSLPTAHCAWLLGITSLLYVGALLALACGGAVIDYHGGWLPRVMGLSGLLVVGTVSMVATGASRGTHLASLRRMALALPPGVGGRRRLPLREVRYTLPAPPSPDQPAPDRQELYVHRRVPAAGSS